MRTRATVSADGETITVHIPLTFRKRGGRKLVVTPDGAEWAPRPRVDNAMVKALARAFRWRKMLDDGRARDAGGLGRAKGVNATYVSRVLRLTLLAPEIVEAILDGRQPAELQLDDLLEAFPLDWRANANAAGAGRSGRQPSSGSVHRDGRSVRKPAAAQVHWTPGSVGAIIDWNSKPSTKLSNKEFRYA